MVSLLRRRYASGIALTSSRSSLPVFVVRITQVDVEGVTSFAPNARCQPPLEAVGCTPLFGQDGPGTGCYLQYACKTPLMPGPYAYVPTLGIHNLS
jgi:hypothetical protein